MNLVLSTLPELCGLHELFSCLRGGIFQFKTRTTTNMSAEHRMENSKRSDKKAYHEPVSEQPVDNLGDAFSSSWSRQD